MAMVNAICVVDGKGFIVDATEYAEVIDVPEGVTPMLVCSGLCAEKYDINCLDWTEAKRDALGIRAY